VCLLEKKIQQKVVYIGKELMESTIDQETRSTLEQCEEQKEKETEGQRQRHGTGRLKECRGSSFGRQ